MDAIKYSELLNVKNLKTYFYLSQGKVRAVDGIDLSIPYQKAVGLVGESGCGKSATALSILRLLPSPPSNILDGEVLFKGRDLLKLSEKELRDIRGREISIVFQDPMTFLNPVLKIGDQMSETIREHQSINKKDIGKKIIELLEHVGIPSAKDVIEYYPHQLSGGMRQRVLIAMALSCDPSLVIMDEPTTALDVTIQRQILELIKRLIKEYDMSILLITHDLGIVAEICDYIYIMYAGKIVEMADVFTIFEAAKHPYTKGLLASSLSIEEHKSELIGIEGNVPDLISPPSGCKFHPRCEYAKESCKTDEPPMTEYAPDHFIRCWLE
jgi:oligopeptide/dipeptide ABC transporter ATP-binding protein